MRQLSRSFRRKIDKWNEVLRVHIGTDEATRMKQNLAFCGANHEEGRFSGFHALANTRPNISDETLTATHNVMTSDKDNVNKAVATVAASKPPT